VIVSRLAGGRFTTLRDVEAMHHRSPITFSIPRSDLRKSLKPGALVKLVFSVSSGPETAERMWVVVLSTSEIGYIGRLDDEPTLISDLSLDDEIHFGPEHVAALWRSLPLSPRPEQFAVVSSAIWGAGRMPVRAVRRPPPDDEFSGWFLFAEGDPTVPPRNLAGFEPVNHHELTSRYRMFDSIEEEAPGTEWVWDSGMLEWRQSA